MSLRDDLDAVTMKQTRDYQEESSKTSSKEAVDDLNSNILIGDDSGSGRRKEHSNPFKRKVNNNSTEEDTTMDKTKMFKVIGIAGLVIVVLVVFFFVYKLTTADKGASFYQELEDGAVASFQYSSDERETLRINGYTADDIERFEVEERDPKILVEDAKEKRELLYDAEIKPYLDGASPEFQTLKSLTWLGTGEMSSEVLSDVEDNYEERFGTYNCDYVKVTPMGSQLFIKLTLVDFNTEVFMSITPERYKKLSDTGNIVVVIDYNKYNDGKILVTEVREKDIKK